MDLATRSGSGDDGSGSVFDSGDGVSSQRIAVATARRGPGGDDGTGTIVAPAPGSGTDGSRSM
jgi:hypothetical protein